METLEKKKKVTEKPAIGSNHSNGVLAFLVDWDYVVPILGIALLFML